MAVGFPELCTSNPHYAGAWQRLRGYIDSVAGQGGSGSVPLANRVFVDKSGNDSTGLPYRLDKPFLTIAAAIDVAANGDEIVVGAGTFAEAVTVPATMSLHIVGSGRQTTTITSITWNASGDHAFTISDVNVTGAISLTPTFNFLGQSTLVRLQRIQLGLQSMSTASIHLTNVYNALVDDVRPSPSGNTIYVSECGTIILHDISVDLSVDSTAVTQNPIYVLVDSALTGGITQTGLAKLSMGDCKLAGTLTATLSYSANSLLLANGCSFGGQVSISFNDAVPLGQPSPTIANLSCCSMDSLVLSSIVGQGGTPVIVRAASCDIPGAIQVDSSCMIDIRGSTYTQGNLSLLNPGDGTILRNMHRVAGLTFASTGSAVSITPPMPDAQYVVAFMPTSGLQAAPEPSFSGLKGGGNPSYNLSQIEVIAKDGTAFTGVGFVNGVAGSATGDVMVLHD